MKELSIILVATVVGSLLGGWIATREVGEVEQRFAPPPPVAASASKASAPAVSTDEVGVSAALPRVEIEETTHNFGVMQRGASDSHEFLFTNSGDADLWLEVGSTSCKCTAATASERPVKPGESAAVEMQWSAKTGAGPFQQRATIHTTDPRTPQIDLMVVGEVVERSGLKPGEFVLGKMRADEARTATVYLASFVEEGLEATAEFAEESAKPDNFELRVQSVPVAELPFDGAQSGVRIDLTTRPGLPIGRLNDWVRVRANLADIGDVLIPVLGTVEGDISIHGRGWSDTLGLLNLGKVSNNEDFERDLILSIKGEHAEAIRVEPDEIDPTWLGVDMGEPKRVREGVTHIPMRLCIPAGQSPVIRTDSDQGAGDARIRLITNHPTSPELDVRVRFIVIE